MQEKTQTIPICKIDDEIFSKEIDLIKIDVEGFELAVIKGATKLLKANNFPPILFEVWDFEWFSTSKNELLEFIKNLGYEVFYLFNEDYIAQHPLNKIKVNLSRVDDGVVNIERVASK